MTQAKYRSENEIIITREFNAPRQLVWKAWNEAEYLERWFGPEGFDAKVNESDFREGGKFEYIMIGPDGTEYPSTGLFLEIIENEKVVATDEFGEGFENIEAMKDIDLPQGMLSTTLFEDSGDNCLVTIRTSHPTPEDKKKHEDMGVVEGWNSSLDKFERLLAEIRA